MEQRNILFALQHAPNIGWKTIKQLMDHLHLDHLVHMDAEDIHQTAHIPIHRAQLICDVLQMDKIQSLIQKYDQAGISWTAWGDPQYPTMLQETHWAPWILYYRGDLSLLDNPCVAIVGTRVPTVYGKRTAESLAKELSDHGYTIVSGLARGIDSYAHRGGLAKRGKTIAVMGTSFDTVYPPENKSLCRQIEEEGLVMTEVPLSTKSHKGLFPLRNRIIASLALGTVVVEGSLNSGSLITAYLGLDYLSRDVFAVPGPIYSPLSEGPHDLLRRGAILVTKAEDIIQEYERVFHHKSSTSDNDCTQEKLDESEETIIRLLQETPLHIEELLHLSKFTFGHLHSVLLSLSMKQKIEHLPGSIYQLRLEM